MSSGDVKHGVFISFKKEDKNKGYLKAITDKLEENDISYSCLDKTIDSDNIDTVISVLRKEYMNNKPVTLFLIGENSYEDTKKRWKEKTGGYFPHDDFNEQSFIIRELRATLSDYDGNPRHGVLGIVLPEMVNKIFKGHETCSHCGCQVNVVKLDDETVIREFWQNYYLINSTSDCPHFSEEQRYCVICTLEEFLENPEFYINKAFDKTKTEIAKHVHYKDIEHDYKTR